MSARARPARLLTRSALVLVLAPLASAQLVDFDELVGGSNPVFTTLIVGSFRLSSQHAHVVGNFRLPSYPVAENGSPVYIAHDGPPSGAAVTFARDDGSPFTLVALEAAELWIPGTGAPLNGTHIAIVGQRALGGALAAVVALDGIVDGAGGAEDFQDVHLSGFDDLLSVTFDGWIVGAGSFAIAFDDVATLTDPWTNRGSGVAGARGVPALVGSGPTATDPALWIELANAPPASLGMLFISIGSDPLPLRGDAALLTSTPLFSRVFETDSAGRFEIRGTPPIDVFPPGTEVVLQAAVPDPLAPRGVALSNAIQLRTGALQRENSLSILVGPGAAGQESDPISGAAPHIVPRALRR